MTALIKILRGQRGSVGASVLFVMFSAVTMTAILSVVLATMNAASSSRNFAASSASAAIKKTGYLSSLALNPAEADTGSECVSTGCGSVTAAASAGGLVTLTLKGLVTGTGASVSQDTVLRKVDANYVAGYDAAGNPVWVSETGTTPHKFKDLTSNGDYSCGIDISTSAPANENTVWCWGSNVAGQLGDGTTRNSYEPVKIKSTETFSSLGNGSSFGLCALSTSNQAFCWGSNSNGQLGDTNVGGYLSTPTAIPGGHSFTKLVQSATTTCGIEAGTAKIFCWGENNGDGVKGPTDYPVQVAGANQYTKLAMDRTTACALDTTSRILCWSANGLGQVGVKLASFTGGGGGGFQASTASFAVPAAIIIPAGQDKAQDGSQSPEDLGTGWTDVAVGNEERDDMKSTVCALETDGTTWCWGSNSSGQLGNGSTVDAVAPVQVTGGHTFSKLAVSPESVCGIEKTTEALWCWGANDFGQLGNGTTDASAVPVAVDPTTKYSSVRAATGNKKWFCGITTADSAKCWGRNSFGQMATGSSTGNVLTPTTVAGFTTVTAVSLGDHFACAQDNSSVATCWGRNNFGQAGAGFRSPVAPSPLEFTGPARVGEAPYTFPGYTGYVDGGAQ